MGGTSGRNYTASVVYFLTVHKAKFFNLYKLAETECIYMAETTFDCLRLLRQLTSLTSACVRVLDLSINRPDITLHQKTIDVPDLKK